MTSLPPDPPRLWVEFPDPDEWDAETEHPHTMIRADATWLTSSWSCVFGRGCQGIDADSPNVGCCRLGAHFSEPSDEARVSEWVAKLTPELWQRHPGRPIKRKDWTTSQGKERQTRLSQYGCIFANDIDFPGGSGCALHHLAAQEGVPHVVTKPDVCWQLPIRRTYRTVTRPDETEYLEITLAEYDYRGWGPGGEDLDWYCTNAPVAHVGEVPVYVSMADEIREMIGASAYAELVRHLEAVGTAHKLLPLAVHPATQATKEPGCGRRATP